MTPQATALCAILQADFPWHRARLKFLAAFILAVLQVTTVNLSKLANALNGQAKRDSNYRRLQRFLADFEIEYSQIARWLLRVLPAQGPWIVSIDRTDWQFGQFHINILMAGIVYRGLAFPLAWLLLNKRGNSNTDERQQVMRRLLTVLEIAQIKTVTADREFIGDDWFTFLENKQVPYAIRIRDNALVTGTDGPRPARTLFADLAIGQTRMLRKPRKVYAHRVYLSVLRLSATELLIVASSQPGATALADYACRWGIEVLFAALKTRGFNLEETHLTAQARIEKLLGLLAIALTWAYLIGHWVVEAKPLTIKNHGRPARSIFRIGLDEIQYVLLNIQDHQHTFFQYLWLLLYPAPGHSV